MTYTSYEGHLVIDETCRATMAGVCKTIAAVINQEGTRAKCAVLTTKNQPFAGYDEWNLILLSEKPKDWEAYGVYEQGKYETGRVIFYAGCFNLEKEVVSSRSIKKHLQKINAFADKNVSWTNVKPAKKTAYDAYMETVVSYLQPALSC